MVCENNEHVWVKRPTYARKHSEYCRDCNVLRHGRIHARRLERLLERSQRMIDFPDFLGEVHGPDRTGVNKVGTNRRMAVIRQVAAKKEEMKTKKTNENKCGLPSCKGNRTCPCLDSPFGRDKRERVRARATNAAVPRSTVKKYKYSRKTLDVRIGNFLVKFNGLIVDRDSVEEVSIASLKETFDDLRLLYTDFYDDVYCTVDELK